MSVFIFFWTWTWGLHLFDDFIDEGLMYVGLSPSRAPWVRIGLGWRKESVRKLKEEQRVALNVCVSSADTTTHRETRQWVRADMCRQHITTFLSIGPYNPSPSYRSQMSLRSRKVFEVFFFFSFFSHLSVETAIVLVSLHNSHILSLRFEMLAEYYCTVWHY